MNTYVGSVTGCGTCEQCCSSVQTKRAVEKKALQPVKWLARLPEPVLSWTLKKVKHTVMTETGSALLRPQYDPSLAYAGGVTLSVGTAIYQTTGAVAAGQTPVSNPGLFALQAGTNEDLFVSYQPDFKRDEWIDPAMRATHVVVQGGQNGTSYRVEAEATFRNCDGFEQVLWDCILVDVKDCRAG